MGAGGKDLFLSHSSGDGDAAAELKAVLEEGGYSVWMAPDDIVGARPWAEQIVDAIQSTRAMVVVISSSANGSPYVSREVNLALSHGRAVLPVRIEPVTPGASLELFLSLVQRVDAFPAPISNHRDRILKRLALTLQDQTRTTDVLVGAVPPGRAIPSEEASTSVSAPVPLVPRVAVPVDLETPPVAPAALGPGSRVGAFTIETVLGEGGMATVYRARQDDPSRSVALKVIRADHAADPAYRERFLSETATLASLEHPGIIPIYAAGEANGVLYIAMRLVDGPDLAGDLAQAGHLTLARTIDALSPIADAIDYAHEMGVVHRDLNPSNIVLDKRGRPYLMDFGLGKHFDRSQGLSAPGLAVGTLEYMAPEQFSGLVDPPLAGRIDVYALGCVAFACLAGVSPFHADAPERVMFAHLHENPPSIRELRPELPSAVDFVLRRALSKNPSERYASAREFIDALTAAAQVADQPTVAIVPPRRSGFAGALGPWARANTTLAGVLVAAVAVLIVGTGLLGLNLTGSASSGTPGASSTAGVALATLTPPSVGPTELETVPASEEPTETVAPADSDPPTPPPPTPDRQAPTGVDLLIKSNAENVVYSTAVDLTLKASGATQMLIGNATSSTATCAWSSWRSFATSLANWKLSGTTAGTKWVCAAFRDAAQNTSYSRDSVYFDHRPVDKDYTYDYSNNANTCSTIKTYGGFSLTLIPYVAKDPDAGDSVTVTSVTKGTASYVVTDHGTKVNIYYTVTSNFVRNSTTFAYHAVDEHGGSLSGTFTVIVGPCPP